ncbi:MAG TPA: hypothetical protein VGP57_05945 [Actinoplanes sp.]|jgi:hypothetical protein|nr:hypothetical protein [Actinoplanes sp.]
MTTDMNESTGAQAVLPVQWEPGPAHTDLGERETFFRFPAADDPNPGTRRLLAMSLYAALLGLAGVGVGARGLVSTIGGGVPGWYVPVLAFAGMLSVALSVGAYLSIHRPVLPWLLLISAAAPLAGAVLLAVAY